MLTFFAFCLLAMVLLPIAGVAMLGALVGAVIWMVLFPIRLILKLTFGLLGGLLGLLFVPIILVGLLIAALVPLAPLAAIVLIGWAIYKGVSRRRWSPAI
jgi:hypothetical protein